MINNHTRKRNANMDGMILLNWEVPVAILEIESRWADHE